MGPDSENENKNTKLVIFVQQAQPGG